MNNPTIKVALFDIDETLLSRNSMLDFLLFFFREYHGEQLGKIREIKYLSKINDAWKGCRREDLNRYYYTQFQHVKKSTLDTLGKHWYEQNIVNNTNAFNQAVLNQLHSHRQDNFTIVLVSGGFFAPLNPLVQSLEINHLLCIKPVIQDDDVLTGEIEGIQTIGEGKATAILNHFNGINIDWNASFAYGDHISDLPMLQLTGNPVVTGNNPDLLKIAQQNQWNVI